MKRTYKKESFSNKISPITAIRAIQSSVVQVHQVLLVAFSMIVAGSVAKVISPVTETEAVTAMLQQVGPRNFGKPLAA